MKSKKLNARTIAAFAGVLLFAGIASAVTSRYIGNIKYANAPASVSWVVPNNGGTWAGIGLFSIKVMFGDDASAANTFTLKCISGQSGLTNTVLTQIFTNTYVYAPSPIYFAAGDTLVFANTETGADIDAAYDTY